jgi:aminoglycoside phosphotransferase (APT) family kinase protein
VAALKMHDDEVDTDVSLVVRLLATQFPQWSGLPVAPVDSAGTQNAIYRLGNNMAVRLPRIEGAVSDVHKEHHWLPRLRPQLPLAIPLPLAKGQPGEGYPWHWSVHRWFEGETAALHRIADPNRAATDLGRFMAALQQIDPSGGPRAADHHLRGVSLQTRDASTREAIAALRGMFDTDAMTAAWEAALRAPEWDRAPVWFHGDLLPANLLVDSGRLCAVIDFGGLGVGDPACDLMVAWGLFSGASRRALRAALQVDDATWARGRGHALSQALIFIPYYLRSNPIGVDSARRTVNEVLAEHCRGG